MTVTRFICFLKPCIFLRYYKIFSFSSQVACVSYLILTSVLTETRVKNLHVGTSLAVQWLRLCASTAGGTGLIPGWGTRYRMHAATKESPCRN